MRLSTSVLVWAIKSVHKYHMSVQNIKDHHLISWTLVNFAHLKPLCPELSQELVWIWVWGIHTWGVWAAFRHMFDLGAGMCRSCQALCRLTHQHRSLNTTSLIILCNMKRREYIFIEFSHFTFGYRQIHKFRKYIIKKNSQRNLSQVQQNLIIIMQLFCLWRRLLFPDPVSLFLQCGTADMLLWTLTEPVVRLHTPLEVMKCDPGFPQSHLVLSLRAENWLSDSHRVSQLGWKLLC